MEKRREWEKIEGEIMAVWKLEKGRRRRINSKSIEENDRVRERQTERGRERERERERELRIMRGAERNRGKLSLNKFINSGVKTLILNLGDQ